MSKWPIVPLRGHIAEVSERKGGQQLEIFSVTNTNGFVRSLEAFDKQVFSEDASSYKVVQAGDLAYNPSRINVGSVACCQYQGGGAVSPMYVVVRCRPTILPSYLLYFLKSDIGLQNIRHRCEGAVRFQLKYSDLERIELAIPSVAEQERIVRLLDEAAALRSLRTQADNRTAAAIPALFDEMFGAPEEWCRWQTKSFEELANETQLGLVRGTDEMGASREFAYLRMDALSGDGTLDLSDMRRVDASPNEAARYSLSRGDFLFNTRNSRELVGKTAVFEDFNEPVLFNNNLMRVRFSEEVEPLYVLWLFHTAALRHELELRKAGTTSVVAIYWKALKTIPVPVPPIRMQRDFAARVAEIRALEAEQAASRKRLDDLFQSFLHRAFSGDL